MLCTELKFGLNSLIGFILNLQLPTLYPFRKSKTVYHVYMIGPDVSCTLNYRGLYLKLSKLDHCTELYILLFNVSNRCFQL